MKNILILAIVLMISGSATAQNYTEEDYRMFKESQPLTGANLQLADEDTPWSIDRPKRVYCLHDEGDETIVTFAQSIYYDSQWVTFSKGIVIVDRKTGDEYHAIDYAMEGFTMDKLIAVKGCNGNNVLISIRFPKLGSKVKKIDVFSFGHEDDLKPSNSKTSSYSFGENLSVKELKKKYKELSASHKSVKRLDDTIIYDNHSVTTKAEFPGGAKQNKLFKQAFFSDYIANKERLVGEGLISYTFVIDQEGNVRDVEILQSIGPRYDLAVIRLCKKMPKWKPATLNGETVCVRVKDFIAVKKKGEDYDIGPCYPGGSEALEAYLTVSGYRDADIGFVSVTFVIDECGNVIDAEVIKGLGRPANNMALDLVKSMKWIPAQKGGKPIRVRKTVYVDFIDIEESK